MPIANMFPNLTLTNFHFSTHANSLMDISFSRAQNIFSEKRKYYDTKKKKNQEKKKGAELFLILSPHHYREAKY